MVVMAMAVVVLFVAYFLDNRRLGGGELQPRVLTPTN
jgi:hypothetical protein